MSTVKDQIIEGISETPQPLKTIYNFIQFWRPGTAEETIRARIYEALHEGKIIRISEGVFFARQGQAQMLVVTGNAWDVMAKLDSESIDLLVTDPPGKWGREWAGMGTTRPHSKLGGRTYQQPELDKKFFEEAFRILKSGRQWNTLSIKKREAGDFPHGGAACIIRVPLENRTTRPSIRSMIDLATSLGFVYYGEIIITMDSIGMGYDSGRDKGSKWVVLHKGFRNGILWDLSMPNVIEAKRLKNPAKLGAIEHEAEKDPAEVVPLLKAFTRAGDIVLDPFSGMATWAKEALTMGRNVILADAQETWTQRIADRFGLSGSSV